MKIIEKLSSYAALIGVIGAIGGGFYTWGQFNLRLDQIENKEFVVNETVDLSGIEEKISTLEVEVIDRINAVEEQIKPTDLTGVFKEIGKIKEQIAMLPKPANTKPIYDSLTKLEEYAWELEEDIEELSKDVAIVKKENEILREGKIELKVNGIIKQASNIKNMAWGIEDLISCLSKYITLKPGDIIFTGTPAGVGKIYPGDKIEASIENVGKLTFSLT